MSRLHQEVVRILLNLEKMRQKTSDPEMPLSCSRASPSPSAVELTGQGGSQIGGSVWMGGAVEPPVHLFQEWLADGILMVVESGSND